MSRIDYEQRRIELKLVYYGPAGSGKTATLEHIYGRTRDPNTQRRWAASNPSSGTHYDYLPMALGEIRGFRTEMGLFTVPSGEAHVGSRRHILEHVDGVVFVADCHEERIGANNASLNELHEHLASLGFRLDKLPYVVQLNHSDAATAASPARVATPLIRWHPDPAAVPVHTSCAPTGQGVFETLKAITKLCLTELKRNA